MLVLIRRVSSDESRPVATTLSLTAAERVRSRHRFQADDGRPVYLNLPRGTVLRGGDRLATAENTIVTVVAKPEPVLTVTATTPLQLVRAAYHLGNRHVPLEVTATYLRLTPDPVLEKLLLQLGVQVTAEVAAFEPEAGAYGHHGH
ncbi:Urease accessory protein UreE [Halomicronema hongdechloris C2206]|uniref:Urease accessory protein UreE n=1 Tax=Halomicronema hongdechloris C2206 TaxID=1641165 RepID=A0A1Z3HVG7_9CYAN|nr:urease accessory protein UreE [Halomicronema hongdechloris]ASC74289.1 Urease accessory protein UreE [Halomicronema hongdechloris C2206]